MTRTHDQMFAFSEFCVMDFVGRHPCRDDGSASFFLMLKLSLLLLLFFYCCLAT
jgi:hypothetical protein